MQDLELFREILLAHRNKPKQRQELINLSHSITGHCPECMDALTIAWQVDQGIVTNVAFQGEGCAMSTASVSLLMTFA